MAHAPTRITTEKLSAERPKYTAPLVFVAGLWCRAAVWRPMMGYLTHRGWECIAIDFESTSESTLATRRDALVDHLSTYASPPVVIGHDAGALLVMGLPITLLRALVAMAPFVPEGFRSSADPIQRSWAVRLGHWRRALVAPPRGRLATQLFAESPPGGTRAEPAMLIRELGNVAVIQNQLQALPALFVAGSDDPRSPPDDVHRLAEAVGAEYLLAAGATHAMPWDRGWNQRVGEVHRWIIRVLGEPLLAMLDEEE